MAAQTLYEKIWNNNLVREKEGEVSLIYVDLQLVHEVTSPQAFEGLMLNGRSVRRKEKTKATLDHSIPTKNRHLEIADAVARLQVETLRKNCAEHSIELFDLDDQRQGIVHVIAPEQGITQPGMVIVCGDSHTATHGAFGTLSFGIGTSEVEHVLATQTLQQFKSKTMNVHFDCELPQGVTAKDMTLAVIGKTGVAGGNGYVIEYTGKAVEGLSMEGRMTLCNMAIEGGARAGMVAPDETTFEYLRSKPRAPKGEAWKEAMKSWKRLYTDQGAHYDKTVIITAEDLKPQVTWGTSPEQVVSVTDRVPKPEDFADPIKRASCQKALAYMGLEGGEKMTDIRPDFVFIGSCTNARIEDLRVVASIMEGKSIAPNIEAIIVPGSGLIKEQAEAEGLDAIFKKAGCEWRDPGCSMCLGMNDDILAAGRRCASTSNRNFEGRQGKGARTHLVSPAMAAAVAINGHFVDVRHM